MGIDAVSRKRIHIHENGSLSINHVQEEDLEYVYICSVANGIQPDLTSKVSLALISKLTDAGSNARLPYLTPQVIS